MCIHERVSKCSAALSLMPLENAKVNCKIYGGSDYTVTGLVWSVRMHVDG